MRDSTSRQSRTPQAAARLLHATGSSLPEQKAIEERPAALTRAKSCCVQGEARFTPGRVARYPDHILTPWAFAWASCAEVGLSPLLSRPAITSVSVAPDAREFQGAE